MTADDFKLEIPAGGELTVIKQETLDRKCVKYKLQS